MNRIQELLAILSGVAADPAKAVADHARETGQGAVGVMPVYAPEEIIHAAGCLPVGLWGGRTSIGRARAYLPPFACSIMQSVMELQLRGVYNSLRAVVFSVPCDTLKCMSQKWYGTPPTITFAHPQNRNLASATAFLAAEYANVKARLEDILQTSITEQALCASIDVYNENRRAMRAFAAAAARQPQLIDPLARHNVFKSRWFMEKSRHTALVRELTAALDQQSPQPWPGKRVILTGITAEPDELLTIIRDSGFSVAGDDLAQESRQCRTDIPDAGGNALSRLASWWPLVEGCSLATDRAKGRGAMLIDMAHALNADAVIFCMMKFCDPEEFDYPILYPQLEAAGIRNLLIEIDQEAASFEQVRTRVQTFGEMMLG